MVVFVVFFCKLSVWVYWYVMLGGVVYVVGEEVFIGL